VYLARLTADLVSLSRAVMASGEAGVFLCAMWRGVFVTQRRC
jgi:hypothetical protein